MKFSRNYWIGVASGHIVLSVIDWLFDNPLYIAVIAIFGPLKGGLIMMVASTVMCGTYLFVYERMGIDWLGVNAIELVKEKGAGWAKKLDSSHVFVRLIAWIPSRLFLLVLWAIKKSDVTAFIALSIYEDAFKTTAFLRKGKFGSFEKKDLKVFLGSIILSNAYWVLRNSVLIEMVKIGWKQINL